MNSLSESASSREKVLHLLKVGGPCTASQLAVKLGFTMMGVRRQLLRLEQAGLVSRRDARGTVGRPSQIWDLTRDGHSRFADRHADLAVRLLRAIHSLHGQEGLQAILAEMRRLDVGRVLSGLDREADLPSRVHALAELRREQGYMAEHRRGESGEELLVERHCPLQAAAGACESLCESELAFFQALLGEDVTIERAEHMQGGDRCCTYEIRAPQDIEV